MKTNNAYDKGEIKNNPDVLGAHALYLARFVQAYEQEGIHLFAVFPQNEPGWAQDYPSCGWGTLLSLEDNNAKFSDYYYVDYITNYLAPTLQQEGLDTEIWLGTLSNPGSDHELGQTVMNNSAAGAKL